MMLTCSLPTSYKHFCETLIYGHESLKIDDVKSLPSHKKMEDHNKNHNDAASSLVARGNWKDVGSSSCRGKFGSESRYHEGKCKYCTKEWHWKANCPKLRKRNI